MGIHWDVWKNIELKLMDFKKPHTSQVKAQKITSDVKCEK